jgi:hypothetical protein
MVPVTVPCTCSPTQIPTQLSSTGLGYDFVPSNALFVAAYNNNPQDGIPTMLGAAILRECV